MILQTKTRGAGISRCRGSADFTRRSPSSPLALWLILERFGPMEDTVTGARGWLPQRECDRAAQARPSSIMLLSRAN